ncbi:GNAT family N-acetyltransferase [Thermoactinospora rubra]|uniref:GNAT family N-acetyltransferase n=1 Tax=Thermoactinospora rubra TaxID=1088767 RepID=UPI000A0FF8CC|nr:GNAT family protein [Thermoactinospora rubra]
MLKPDYPLLTDRLALRPFTLEDLPAYHAYGSRPDVVRYLYWQVRDLPASRAALEQAMTRTSLQAEGDALELAVTSRASGELLGSVLLFWRSQEHRQGEIGYVLHPDHHGHGYATEAARVMLHLGFDRLELHRVYGRLDARNTASARVLEKLGMRREAHLVHNEYVKGEWTDEVIYAMLRSEWRP